MPECETAQAIRVAGKEADRNRGEQAAEIDSPGRQSKGVDEK